MIGFVFVEKKNGNLPSRFVEVLEGTGEGLPFLPIGLRVVEPIHFGSQFERPADVICPSDRKTHEIRSPTASRAAIYFTSGERESSELPHAAHADPPAITTNIVTHDSIKKRFPSR